MEVNMLMFSENPTREEVLRKLIEGGGPDCNIHVCIAETEGTENVGSNVRLYMQDNPTEEDDYIEVDPSGVILVKVDHDLTAEWVMDIMKHHGHELLDWKGLQASRIKAAS